MNHHNVIYLWTMFGFNFSHDFIEKAFAKKGKVMVNHLRGKFSSCYNNYGSRAAFFVFWAELDNENRQMLEDWVMDNYKG